MFPVCSGRFVAVSGQAHSQQRGAHRRQGSTGQAVSVQAAPASTRGGVCLKGRCFSCRSPPSLWPPTASLAASPHLGDAAVDFKHEGDRKVASSLPCHLQQRWHLWREQHFRAALPGGKETLASSRSQRPSQIHALGAIWICYIPSSRWESRGHPSFPSTARCVLAPQCLDQAGCCSCLRMPPCPCCWQRLQSFFPCDKYGNRVCTGSELGINSIAQIGES